MLEVRKNESYVVSTCDVGFVMGVGKTPKEAIEDYLKEVRKTVDETEKALVKLRSHIAESEEMLKRYDEDENKTKK